ncbi:hypothetical protein [Rhizobium sp. BG4]|uniref:hypothetical protein n=1 Tax=Rhizobium sp. BG4 TaxID=2613770 RepID=UPI00193E0FF3|nr:hypothetical protein [Rhizobium sp. BG4]
MAFERRVGMIYAVPACATITNREDCSISELFILWYVCAINLAAVPEAALNAHNIDRHL